ncbi:nitrate high affinity transporter [Gigaspora rosea]|uniref:Nitrate high affinity transporter n=1 Tax=Gigaspora rosea TaxID=44941 RepID=A0A397W038_9GLOM|nr:nitrate high affinity transporter [Gigaspora rosea]
MIDVKLKTSPPPTVDENDRRTKAKCLHILNFSKPHGRTFHVAWFSFMIAFTSWYSIAPLKPYIKSDLNLNSEIATSDILAVSANVIFLVTAGLLCDVIGPRRVMATFLLAGSIPVALASLIHNADGLYAIRFFIGVLGACFVPCQFYTTQMYEKNVVGSANAFAGGWGNLGGGFAYILMPLVFNAINSSVNDTNISWRLAMIIPAGLCIIAGLMNIFLADDCPAGDWLKQKKSLENVEVKEVLEASDKMKIDAYVENSEQFESTKKGKFTELSRAFSNPYVLIMMMQYACTFGVELAIDNVIGTFFITQFGLANTSGNFIGAVFGLMNLFSRATGGIVSDYANKKFGIRGRLLSQVSVLLLEGIFLIIFRFSINSLTSAIVVMIFFSFFTQAGCGTTYSIAPYIDPPIYGTIAGLIGTGGTLGGLMFNSIFAHFRSSIPEGFLVTGIIVTVLSLTTFLLKVSGEKIIPIKRLK